MSERDTPKTLELDDKLFTEAFTKFFVDYPKIPEHDGAGLAFSTAWNTCRMQYLDEIKKLQSEIKELDRWLST